MSKYLSVKINNPETLIGLAIKALIKGETSITFTASENEFKKSGQEPDFISKKTLDCGIWVKESAF